MYNVIIHIDTGAFTPLTEGDGDRGVFTTFTTHTIRGEQRLPSLDLHLERVFKHGMLSGAISATVSAQELNNLKLKIRESLLSNSAHLKVEKSIIRILLNKAAISVFIDKYNPPWQGGSPIRLCSVPMERTTPEIKTHLAPQSIAARKVATQKGYEEALLIDKDTTVREGAWSNIFWFNDQGELFTTKDRILPGIVRQLIIDNHAVSQVNISLSELKSVAKEVFITQSTTGITPVTKIDEDLVGGGPVGEMTLRLIEWYGSHVLTKKELP